MLASTAAPHAAGPQDHRPACRHVQGNGREGHIKLPEVQAAVGLPQSAPHPPGARGEAKVVEEPFQEVHRFEAQGKAFGLGGVAPGGVEGPDEGSCAGAHDEAHRHPRFVQHPEHPYVGPPLGAARAQHQRQARAALITR